MINFVGLIGHKIRKKHHRRKNFIWWPIITFILVGAIFASYIIRSGSQSVSSMDFGVTYSVNYVEEFGMDWKEVFDATVDELGVRKIRLPIYWNQVEPLPDRYDFSKFDYMIKRAEETDTKLIVAIGRRLPRWPECHEPAWIYGQPEVFKQKRILSMLRKVVERYKNSPAIVSWQVDNEPFFTVFGECPKYSENFLLEEVELVRDLDPTKPITITDSGELSTWLKASEIADQLGISMYRVTWNQYFGYWYYPLSPRFYIRKAVLVKPLVDRMIISELQMEPWSTDMYLSTLSLQEQYRSMNTDRFWHNISFARRTGFDESYLWGVEWWYWLKDFHGDAKMWDAAKELFIQDQHEQKG